MKTVTLQTYDESGQSSGLCDYLVVRVTAVSHFLPPLAELYIYREPASGIVFASTASQQAKQRRREAAGDSLSAAPELLFTLNLLQMRFIGSNVAGSFCPGDWLFFSADDGAEPITIVAPKERKRHPVFGAGSIAEKNSCRVVYTKLGMGRPQVQLTCLPCESTMLVLWFEHNVLFVESVAGTPVPYESRVRRTLYVSAPCHGGVVARRTLAGIASATEPNCAYGCSMLFRTRTRTLYCELVEQQCIGSDDFKSDACSARVTGSERCDLCARVYEARVDFFNSSC